MTARQLIGLHGRAHSGKDTVAVILRERHGFARTAFAQPIKDALCILFQSFGLTRAHFEDPQLKEADLPGMCRSPRYLMQTLGTEWGRHLVGEDLWIAHLERRTKYYGSRIVVTDVRYEDEAQWIRAQGGRVWHITRRDIAAVRAHSSEEGLRIDGQDLVIDNNSTLEELEAAVRWAATT